MIKDIQKAKIKAMKAKEKEKSTVLSGVISEFKNKAIEQKIDAENLAETDIIQMLKKMVAQREGSIVEFEKAGRQDLADKEKREIVIISEFLPKMMSEKESEDMALKAIETLNAKTMKDDMKHVMAWLKEQSGGTINMAVASKTVKQNLS
jgi:uncharacterized protein YqeY